MLLAIPPSPFSSYYGGNNSGVAAFAKTEGVRHYACLESPEGFPFVSELFRVGLKHASHELIVYANADLLFDEGIVVAMKHLNRLVPVNASFLLLGQRRNVQVTALIDDLSNSRCVFCTHPS